MFDWYLKITQFSHTKHKMQWYHTKTFKSKFTKTTHKVKQNGKNTALTIWKAVIG